MVGRGRRRGSASSTLATLVLVLVFLTMDGTLATVHRAAAVAGALQPTTAATKARRGGLVGLVHTVAAVCARASKAAGQATKEQAGEEVKRVWGEAMGELARFMGDEGAEGLGVVSSVDQWLAALANEEWSDIADDNDMRECYQSLFADHSPFKSFLNQVTDHSNSAHAPAVNASQLAGLVQLSEGSPATEYDEFARKVADAMLGLMGLQVFVSVLLLVYGVYSLHSAHLRLKSLQVFGDSDILTEAGRALDQQLLHLQAYPSTLLKHPNPVASTDFGDDDPDNLANIAAALSVGDLKQHLKALADEASQLRPRHQDTNAHDPSNPTPSKQGNGEDDDVSPALTPQQAHSLRAKHLDAFDGIVAAPGSELAQDQQDQLNELVDEVRGYAVLDASKLQEIRQVIEGGDRRGVGIVRREIAAAPLKCERLLHVEHAQAVLSKALGKKLRALKQVPDALAQLPTTDTERLMAEGVEWNSPKELQDRVIDLQRQEDWTRRANMRLAPIADGSDKEFEAVTESARDYALRFMNPDGDDEHELFSPTGKFQWAECVHFYAWLMLPAIEKTAEHPIRCRLVEDWLSGKHSRADTPPDEKEALVNKFRAAMPLAKQFLLLPVREKISRIQHFRYWQQVVKFQKNERARFDLENMTPGEHMELAHLAISKETQALVWTAGWAGLGLGLNRLYWMVGVLQVLRRARLRTTVPCEQRDPDVVYKVLGLYIPGPACPEGGEAVFDIDVPSDPVWRIAAQAVFLRSSPVAAPQKVVYSCGGESSERVLAFESSEEDRLLGEMPCGGGGAHHALAQTAHGVADGPVDMSTEVDFNGPRRLSLEVAVMQVVMGTVWLVILALLSRDPTGKSPGFVSWSERRAFLNASVLSDEMAAMAKVFAVAVVLNLLFLAFFAAGDRPISALRVG